MPVLKKIVELEELEEFNTSSIDMGDIGNRPLPEKYYDIDKFQFTDAYIDFLSYILGEPDFLQFNLDFPVVIP
jgi:hypothetical protein